MIHRVISKTAIAISLACGVFAVIGLITVPAVASVPAWGTGGPNTRTGDVNAVFQLLQSRGLTQYRCGVNLADDTDPYEVQMYHDMVALAHTYGITLKPILFTPFQWGDRTDRGKYPAGDQAAALSAGLLSDLQFCQYLQE